MSGHFSKELYELFWLVCKNFLWTKHSSLLNKQTNYSPKVFAHFALICVVAFSSEKGGVGKPKSVLKMNKVCET